MQATTAPHSSSAAREELTLSVTCFFSLRRSVYTTPPQNTDGAVKEHAAELSACSPSTLVCNGYSTDLTMGALPGAVSLSDALKKTADALLLLRDQTLDGLSVLDPDEPANHLVAMGMRARPLCCLALVERVLQLAYKISPLLLTQKTRVDFEPHARGP